MRVCKTCGRFFDQEGIEFCPDDGHPLETIDSDDSQDVDPLIGQLVGDRFRVVGLLGSGAMGAVYRAVQTSVDREVALKVILGQVSETAARRFLLEARTTSALNHPHIITIHDFGMDRGTRLFFVMELLDGCGLDWAIDTDGAMPWARAARVMAQVCDGLREAHAKEIVHRDLKPSNVFLVRTADGLDHVKLLDFGIARPASDRSSGLTATGAILGTPLYMAPEQARGEKLDHRADIYAAGVILFEMLTGTPPFQSEDPMSVLHQHCQAPVPRLAKVCPGNDFPPALEKLMRKMLEKKRDKRIDSADTVRSRLLSLIDPLPTSRFVPTPTARRIVAAPSTGAESGAALGAAETRASNSLLAETAVASAVTGHTYQAPDATSGGRPRWLWAALAVALPAVAIGAYLLFWTPATTDPTPASNETQQTETAHSGTAKSTEAKERSEALAATTSQDTGTPAADASPETDTPTAGTAPPAAAVVASPATEPAAAGTGHDVPPPSAAGPAPPAPSAGGTATPVVRSGFGLDGPAPPIPAEARPAPAPAAAAVETPAPSVVTLQTDPPGASVHGPYGDKLGVTPLELPPPVVPRTLSVRMKGYKTLEYVLPAGAKGEIPLQLKKKRTRKRPKSDKKPDRKTGGGSKYETVDDM